MKTLILSLGLGLVAALQAHGLPTVVEEEQEDSGTWYLKALASDTEVPGGELGPVSVTPMTIEVLDGGDLKITFTLRIAGYCREISSTLEETEVPGKYTAHGGKHVVQIMKSSVEDHYILYDVTDLHGRQIRTAKLVGRDPDLSQEALKDLRRVAGARGLNTENILLLKQMEACSSGRD